MRVLAFFLAAVLFLLLFFFALSNTATVELRMLGGVVWQAPLVAFLLIFFLGGVAFGMLAMLPSWVRLRLKVARQREALRQSHPQPSKSSSKNPAGPDTIQSVAQSARATS